MKHVFACMSISAVFALTSIAAPPTMPIGMNLPGMNYFSHGLLFNNVMLSSREWLTYDDGEQWDSQKLGSLALDTNGYPLEIPQTIDGKATRVRTLINNCYAGRYRFIHDGDGDITFNVTNELVDGKRHITLDGKCGHKWFQITRSTKGNHVRNIRIVPAAIADNYDPDRPEHLFHEPFLKGIRQFHAIRFMDYLHTNGSNQKQWSDRSTPTYYTQVFKGNGGSIEYAVDLCNYLNIDGWFCVPHAADDDYIKRFAVLVRDRMKPGLKVYLEYSNELWNWQFAQAQWAIKNGRYANTPELNSDDKLYNELRQVAYDYCKNPDSDCHPEKDAHLMQRTFNIWKDAFAEKGQTNRLVRVAAIQVGWAANNQRVLKYLNKFGGADALSPTGYFNYTQADHDKWNAMSPSAVTPAVVIEAVSKRMDDASFYSGAVTTAGDAKEYGLDIVFYEAGQHMQPWKQGDWGYNQAVWDAQIAPGMYDLYVKHWGKLAEIYKEAGGIELNCAFSYVGARESKYGSWGHLETLEQLDDMANIKKNAPKYAALLDMNATTGPVFAALPRTLSHAKSSPTLRMTVAATHYDLQGRALTAFRTRGELPHGVTLYNTATGVVRIASTVR